MSKEIVMQEMMLASIDPGSVNRSAVSQEASLEKLKPREARPLPVFLDKSGDNADGLRQEAYPVRWLCSRYALSRMMAKIVAAEFRRLA